MEINFNYYYYTQTATAGGSVNSLSMPAWWSNIRLNQNVFIEEFSIKGFVLSSTGVPVNWNFCTVNFNPISTYPPGVGFGTLTPNLAFYPAGYDRYNISKFIGARDPISISSVVYGSFSLNDVATFTIGLKYRLTE